MRRIVLLGAGPHAGVVADAIEREGRALIAGVTDTTRAVGDRVGRFEVIGHQDDVVRLMKEHDVQGGVVCLGDNHDRQAVADGVRAQAPDFAFARVVHPAATVAADAEIGEGSVVLAGAVVNPGARIGRHVLLNTRSVVEHDCVLDDYASLGPGALTGGHVRLGRHAAIAIGGVAVERVTIGANSVVAAGSVLLDDLGDDALAAGSPARVVRARGPRERFLK